jgi:creatine kinase
MASHQEIIDKIIAAKKSNPDNLMARHFEMSYYNKLPADLQKRLIKICKSGAENVDSSVGMYAMSPDDYDLFNEYFSKVIRDYHKIKGKIHHITNWDLKSQEKRLDEMGCPDGRLDLAKLGLGTTSMRVRVGRNLATFPLPGAMTREDRIRMEETMVGAFKKLIADPSFGGNYYSLTPGSPYQISDKEYEKLVKDHIMFKDMADDKYLNSAGISSNWPYGRGCYVSADKGFIVWVGEEDHLRIMCMKKGTVLNDVFDRLKTASEVVENYAAKFAKSKSYGFVTSCPTNLGTGMRASIHIKLPNLTADGSDAKAKAVLKPLGLSVRGLGGEHTPIGADGTVDISPSARLMIEEAAIVCNLYQGISLCLKAEKEAIPVSSAKSSKECTSSWDSYSKCVFNSSSVVYGMTAVLVLGGAIWLFKKNKN